MEQDAVHTFSATDLQYPPFERRFWTDEEFLELTGLSSMAPVNALRIQNLMYPGRFKTEYDRWARAWIIDDVRIIHLANQLNTLTGFNYTVVSLILGRIGRRRLMMSICPDMEYTLFWQRMKLGDHPVLERVDPFALKWMQPENLVLAWPHSKAIGLTLIVIDREYVLLHDPSDFSGVVYAVGRLEYAKSKYPKINDIEPDALELAIRKRRCVMQTLISVSEDLEPEPAEYRHRRGHMRDDW